MAHLLHLLGADLPTGTAKQIGYLSDGLRSQGYISRHCSVEFSQPRKRILRSFLPDIQFCRQSLRFDPTLVFRVAKQIRMIRPDIVHCWGKLNPALVRMAIRLGGGPAEVWSIRSEAEKENLGKLGGAFSTVANATHLIDGLESHASTKIINNGLLVAETPNIVAPLIHELELDSDTQFVAAVGDLRSKKQLSNLVWSLDLLRVIHPNIHLLVVGDGAEKQKLSSFIHTTSCPSAVHLLGHCQEQEIATVLRQCVCFWQASNDEGCSNAMLEAMSLGIPIIASDSPGHRELTHGDKYGKLVPLGDCAEFARKTNVLLNNLSAAHEKASEARDYVREHYSVSHMVQQFRDFYTLLVDRRSSAA